MGRLHGSAGMKRLVGLMALVFGRLTGRSAPIAFMELLMETRVSGALSHVAAAWW